MGKVTDYWMNEYSKDRSRDMIENLEQKLDKIIELLEKLTTTTNINSPISVTDSGDKDVGVDINKHLYDLVNKISLRHPPISMSDKEFTDRLTKVLADSEKAVEKNKEELPRTITAEEFTKIIIKPTSLHFTREGTSSRRKFIGKDSNGNTVVGGYWNDDGTVLITSYYSEHFSSLGKKKVYKIRVFDADKVFVGWLDDVGVVTLKIPKDKISQLRNDSCADRPWTYKAEWYVEKDNELVEFIPKVFINEITVERKEPQSSPSYYVTGYLTNEGRAVYYDQYL